MGKLVWAACGFAAAAFAAEYLLPISGLPLLAAALAVLSLFGLLLKGGSRRAAMTLTLCAAAGLMMWWGRYELFVAPCEALSGQELTVTARVTDYPDEGSGYTGIPIRILEGAPRVRGYLYSYAEELPALEPGDIITVNVRALSAMELSSGGRRHTQTARGRSFLGRTLGDIEVAGRAASAWLYFPQRLARAVSSLCGELFPADTAAFARALMIGDKSDLYADTPLYGSMRSAGVLHIVAVSGMHIVILISFLQLLMGRSRRTSLICIPVMLVFVLMAGCTASVVRAAVMQSVLLLAPVFEREYDGPSSLAAALLLILLVNPMAAGSVSLQLSFSCVLGFTVLMPGLREWCARRLPMDNRLVRAAAGSVMCSVCAIVFSLPLSAYYFGVIPLFSWLANLLTLTAVEICFTGAYVVCAIGAVLPAVGAALAWLLSWLFRWCMLVYRLIEAIPFGCLYTLSYGAGAWLIGSYALFIVWAILRRRGVRIWLLIPAELCVIGALAVMLAGGVSLLGGAELTVLDVGQGQCVALLDGEAAVIVDCGGSGRTDAGSLAADLLRSRGKSRVDLLVLTHLHRDHTNGVVSLMERVSVSYLIVPGDYDDEDQMLGEILLAAERQDTTVLFLDEELTARVGGLTVTLLLPEAGSDENERGIVVLAESADMSALIMGDAGQSAELALMERGVVPDVDVLVVGHHGSSGATGLLFLRAARAETAAISVGAGNSYGHPAEQTVERLEDSGAEILRTDRDGTITIRQRAGSMLYG